MRSLVPKREKKKKIWTLIFLNVQESKMLMWLFRQKSRKNEGIFSEWMTKMKLKNIGKFWQVSNNEWHLAIFDTNECLHTNFPLKVYAYN